MSQPAVAVISADQDTSDHLQAVLRVVHVEGRVLACALPATTSQMAELAQVGAKVILVDIPGADPAGAIEAIALAHGMIPGAKVVAVGELKDARTVLDAMRAGAADFLERPLDRSQLSRVLQAKVEKQRRGKVYTFVNAKGGSGATTLAVNTGLALTSAGYRVLLLDLAVPGNVALHLNLRPNYTVQEVYGNMHRMDDMLLGGLVMKHPSGMHLLAGATTPRDPAPNEEVASLLDMITARYECVVIDVSTRLDSMVHAVCSFSDQVLMVAQADLASMWNAQKVNAYVSDEGATGGKVKLILNRYRKQSGLAEEEYEKASGCKLVWTVPNQYVTVSNAIMKGKPVAEQASSELREHFLRFAKHLHGQPEPTRTNSREKGNAKSILERVAGFKGFSGGGLKAPDIA